MALLLVRFGSRQLLARSRTTSALPSGPDMPLHSADQRDGKRPAQTDELLDTINLLFV
jgi:hypothetical protein